MANKARGSKKSSTQRRKLTHFFWDKRLHKVLRINRPANLVDAWCYEDHKRVAILLSDFRVKAKKAIQSGEAARLMGCSTRTLLRAVQSGSIHVPQRSYGIGYKTEHFRTKVWWGEHNLLELHEYLMTVHVGRPRLDGRITPSQKLPTRAEIIAKMNNQTTLYVQSDDGIYVPVYDPPKF
jgi:hypothetical protein